MALLPSVELAERSDPGRDPTKQVNEDSVGIRETAFGHLIVVCDGMGGHEGGREASQQAVAAIFEAFAEAASAPDRPSPGHLLKKSLELANARVHALASAAKGASRPGSTVVAALVHAGGTEVAHVGDSRCYLVHAAQVQQVTKDHSLVQQLVDAGVLTPEQAAKHPDANQISRALGIGAEVEVELRPQPVSHCAGDVFVLCSDGLSDLVTPQEVLTIAAHAPAAQAAGQLVDLANARGGHDNVTVAIVRTRESAVVHSSPLAPTLAETSAPGAPHVPPPVPQGSTATQYAVPAMPAPGPRGTVPLFAPQPSFVAAAPAPAHPASPSAERRAALTGPEEGEARRLWPLVLGAILGAVGLGAVGIVAYEGYLEHRGHSSQAGPFSDAGLFPPPPLTPVTTAAPSSSSPTALTVAPAAPSIAPSAAAPSPPPLPPLESAPATSGRSRPPEQPPKARATP